MNARRHKIRGGQGARRRFREIPWTAFSYSQWRCGAGPLLWLAMNGETATDQPNAPVTEPASPPAHEPVFNLAGVVVGAIAICVGIHVMRMFLLTEQQEIWVILRFAFFPARYGGGYDLDLYAFLAPVSYS